MYGTKQFGIIQDFIKGLEDYMESKGYSTISQMRGLTLSQIKAWDTVDRDSRYLSQVDPEKCTGCQLCTNWCFFDAISMVEKKAVIDPHKCDGCGLCPSLCPKDAITMDEPGQKYLGNFR
ncbi:MAG: 4Fe-4S dicluster-binding protein [Desulfitobacteriaceae bacterium]